VLFCCVGTILKDDLIAQSILPIPTHLQSGLLALFAKFDFAIPLDDKYVFVYCLLPEELLLSEKQTRSNEYKTTNNSDSLFKRKLHKGLNVFKKKAIFTVARHKTDSKVKNVVLYKNSSPLDDHGGETIDYIDGLNHTDIEPVFDEEEMVQNDENPNSVNSTSHPYIVPKQHGDKMFPPFPCLNIVDSLSFENSTDLSSANKLQSYNQSWLKAANIDPVLHPPLYRLWLATFVPDGFWPQLFTRIISDNGITSALSTLLHTALQNRECDLSQLHLPCGNCTRKNVRLNMMKLSF